MSSHAVAADQPELETSTSLLNSPDPAPCTDEVLTALHRASPITGAWERTEVL